jgi:hypothetical protein
MRGVDALRLQRALLLTRLYFPMASAATKAGGSGGLRELASAGENTLGRPAVAVSGTMIPPRSDGRSRRQKEPTTSTVIPACFFQSGLGPT